MGSGLTKKKSTSVQEYPQISKSQGSGPAGSITKTGTEKTGILRRNLQQTQTGYSSPLTTVESRGEQDEDSSDLTQLEKDANELQCAETQPAENASLVSKKTNFNNPPMIKGKSKSDTEVNSSPRKDIRRHVSWLHQDETSPSLMTHPMPDLYKQRPQDEFSEFDKRKLLGEQKWREACTESLRNALLPSQVNAKNMQLSRSLPASIERMETVRPPNPSPVKSKDSLRTDRRNSILSSLNCILDVIPENVDDEKDDPDEYEYSEMDLYF